ncbi:hypothetical protein CHLRE_10g466400v5 [Chlamydomonas reinhardtii]|uniref:Uncharacterized protein n=1 Tax=Chlamydomonas reinhardtii TaxID=3055 RepID=A0A2K3DCA5_CHLRE|nr:uncharacterized protein CHLRE_10g466400v5 [Chlamydomonas reinhardtii]PNW78159.1 hypothetical protein CHLRE_10g466400v5 [Chlamydomonas reinhardtii]
MEIETTPDPASLWASDDPAVWRSVLARYPECVETAAGSSKSKAALVELDRWYLQQLAPSLVAQLQQARHQGQAAPGEQQQQQQQQPEEPSGGLGEASEGGSSKVKGKAGGNSGPEAAAAAVAAGGAAGGSDGTGPVAGISRAELVRLVEWKLARGKWRPRLAAFALEQPDGAVEAASGAALTQLAAYVRLMQASSASPATSASPSTSAPATSTAAAAALRGALDALTALKGVGPATASALLSAAAPGGLLPYMGDEALAVAGGGGGRKPEDYSVKAYLQLVAALQAKAEALRPRSSGSSSGGSGGAGGGALTAGSSGSGGAGTAGALGAAELERCLWVAALLSGGGRGGAAAGAAGGGSGRGAAAAGWKGGSGAGAGAAGAAAWGQPASKKARR